MSVEENKAIAVRHFKEVWEQGRVELIDSYFCPDSTTRTAEQLRKDVLETHSMSKDFKVTILDTIGEGDKVFMYTHIEITYLSAPETSATEPWPLLGKPVSWDAVEMMRFMDGKMVGWSGLYGWADMLVQSGVLAPKQG